MTKKSKVPVTVDMPPLPVNLPMPTGTDITPHLLAALAREVAMDIKELPDILKHYKLSQEDYEKIAKIPFYAKALESAVIEWNSALSTPTRIRLEAAAIIEDAMPKLAARMKHQDEAFPAAIEAGKLFTKLAGLDAADKTGNTTGEKFTININLGEDAKLRYEKDVTPAIPIIEKEVTNE